MKNVSEDVEIIGQVVRALILNKNYKNIEEVVQRHHLESIEDDKWYKVSDMLKVIEDIIVTQQSFSSVFDMVAIGMEAAYITPLPPELQDLETYLMTQNDILPVLYRGENIGYIKPMKVATNNFLIHVNLAWPKELLYGNYYGFAKRLLPPGTGFKVNYEDDLKENPDEIVFRISWDS